MAIIQRTFVVTAAAAALAGALTLPVWAQQTPVAPANVAAAPAHPHSHAQRPVDPAAFHAKRMERIKPLLQLTAAQENAWKQYVDATTPTKRPTPRMDREAWKQLTTPQRIEQTQQLRKERNQAMEQRENATKTFYAGLNPAQQKAFDALEPRLHAGGPRHAKHGHGFHKPGHPSHPHQGQQPRPAPHAPDAAGA